MSLYDKIMRKKRAVSPIIAAILLIGLAVLAGAAIFVIVLPMLSASTTPSQVSINWVGTGTASTVNSTTISFQVTVTDGGSAAINVKISGIQIITASTTLQCKYTATAGSTDAVSTAIPIAAGGTSSTITITASNAGYAAGNIKVSIDMGSVGTGSQTFNSKAP